MDVGSLHLLPGQKVERDFAGTESLFFTVSHGSVVVSDKIGVLVGEEPRLCDEYFAGALVGDFSRQSLTPFAGVFRVPAGYELTAGVGGGAALRRWWHPPETDRTLGRADRRELAEHLARLLTQAVQAGLPSGPVGVEVTGGLDSSTIAALACQGRTGVTAGYSFDPIGRLRQSEGIYLDAVLSQCGLTHTVTGDDDVDVDLHRPAWPPPHPTHLGPARLGSYVQADRDGIQTLLSGWGGDQAASFSGVGTLPHKVLHGRLVGAFADLTGAARFHGRNRTRVARLEWAHSVRQPRRDRAMADACRSLCSSAFISVTGMDGLGATRMGPDPDRNRLTWFTNGHLQRRIELYGWDMSATAVSYRYPLLDRSLVEWCLTVPAEHWAAGGIHRALFREAISELVPATIATRPRKNEPDTTGALRARRRHRQLVDIISSRTTNPLVRRYLPNMTRTKLDHIDVYGLNHVDVVTSFLINPQLAHLH